MLSILLLLAGKQGFSENIRVFTSEIVFTKKQERRKKMKSDGQQNTMRYAGLATQLMVMMLIAVWGGNKIDQWLHWKVPVFLILFPLAALGLSLWQIMNEFSKPKK